MLCNNCAGFSRSNLKRADGDEYTAVKCSFNLISGQYAKGKVPNVTECNRFIDKNPKENTPDRITT